MSLPSVLRGPLAQWVERRIPAWKHPKVICSIQVGIIVARLLITRGSLNKSRCFFFFLWLPKSYSKIEIIAPTVTLRISLSRTLRCAVFALTNLKIAVLQPLTDYR